MKAAVTTHSTTISVRLSNELGTAAGEAATVLLDAAVAKLDAQHTALLAAESAHATELADDHPVRSQRDEAITRLYGTLTNLREAANLAATPDYVLALGLFGETPRDASTLGRQALHTAEMPVSVPLPPSRLAGYTLPAREIADGLKQDAAQPSAAVARLAGPMTTSPTLSRATGVRSSRRASRSSRPTSTSPSSCRSKRSCAASHSRSCPSSGPTGNSASRS